MRNYGKVTVGTKYWTIEAEPQVVTRLKRIFPKVRQERARTLQLSKTPENGMDLDWVLERWPMEIDQKTRESITQEKVSFEETRQKVLDIMSGKTILQIERQPLREPRSYQQQAADLAYSTGTLLLTDQLGLGKSYSSLLVLAHSDTLPALVVCPANLTDQWVREVNLSFKMETHILQKMKPYDIIEKENELRRKAAKKTKTEYTPLDRFPDVIITSYNKLAGWVDYLSGLIETVIFDEVQELRRQESQKWKAASLLSDEAKWSVGLTGTPIANHGAEVHHILSGMTGGEKANPLGTKHEFVREWAHSTYNGKVKLNDPAGLALHMLDLGVLLRRKRNEVGLSTKEPLRSVIPVQADLKILAEHTVSAVELAKQIVNDDASPQDRWKASGEFDMKLRQGTALAKAPAAAAVVEMLLEDGEPNLVVFAYHRGVYDIFNERLAKYNPAMYTGSENPARKQAELQKFTDGESRVLMISLNSAAGLDGLQYVTSCGLVAEYPWSPLYMEQALGRIDRPGQEKVVSWNIISSSIGVDPVMENILGVKTAMLSEFNNPNDKKLFESNEKAQERIKLIAQDFLRQQK